MKIRFVYHKGKDSLVGRGIIIWTWILALARCDFKSLKFNFSHVSVWFPDDKDRLYGGDDLFKFVQPDGWFHRAGQCFSSTTRGDAEGVRFAPASKVLHHPERWMYQEYEVADELVERWMPLFKEQVGLKYDFSGLFGFFLPWNPQRQDRWFCSELCAFIGYILDLISKRYCRISPRRLAKILGGELKPLA